MQFDAKSLIIGGSIGALVAFLATRRNPTPPTTITTTSTTTPLSTAADVQTVFAQCVEFVSNGTSRVKVSNEQKLRLYGLYKQVTTGDLPANAEQPSSLDFAAAMKFSAWKKLRGMSKADAQFAYIETVFDIYADECPFAVRTFLLEASNQQPTKQTETEAAPSMVTETTEAKGMSDWWMSALKPKWKSHDEFRAWYDKRCASLNGLFRSSDVSVEDSVTANNNTPFRIYRPTNEPSNLSGDIVIYYHGGGWLAGDLHSDDALCRLISQSAKCTVISVQYLRSDGDDSITPETAALRDIEECFFATEYILENLDSLLGGSAERERRIGVAGFEAGANVALAVCLMTHDFTLDHRIDFAVLLSPLLLNAQQFVESNPKLRHHLSADGSGSGTESTRDGVLSPAFSVPSYLEFADSSLLHRSLADLAWLWQQRFGANDSQRSAAGEPTEKSPASNPYLVMLPTPSLQQPLEHPTEDMDEAFSLAAGQFDATVRAVYRNDDSAPQQQLLTNVNAALPQTLLIVSAQEDVSRDEAELLADLLVQQNEQRLVRCMRCVSGAGPYESETASPTVDLPLISALIHTVTAVNAIGSADTDATAVLEAIREAINGTAAERWRQPIETSGIDRTADGRGWTVSGQRDINQELRIAAENNMRLQVTDCIETRIVASAPGYLSEVHIDNCHRCAIRIDAGSVLRGIRLNRCTDVNLHFTDTSDSNSGQLRVQQPIRIALQECNDCVIDFSGSSPSASPKIVTRVCKNTQLVLRNNQSEAEEDVSDVEEDVFAGFAQQAQPEKALRVVRIPEIVATEVSLSTSSQIHSKPT